MRVARAASAFNKTPCLDGYVGSFLFNCQIGLYDDTKRDSEAGQRRVISLDPGVVIPRRRVIQAAGTRYILGHGSPDSFRGRVIRQGYVGHEATDLVKVRSLLDVVRGAPGIKVWGGRAWIKNLADNEDSSDLTPQYQCHFAQDEKIYARNVLHFGEDILLARTHRVGPAGTRIVLADQLPPGAIQQATLQQVSIDRVTERATTTQTSVTALVARWQSLYEYHEESSPKFGAMDLLVALDSTLGPKAGDLVTLSSGLYRICHTYGYMNVSLCALDKQ